MKTTGMTRAVKNGSIRNISSLDVAWMNIIDLENDVALISHEWHENAAHGNEHP
jgi:hypothetical protein